MCQDFQEQELLMELKMCNSTIAQQVAVSYVEVVSASPTFVVCMQMSAFGVFPCVLEPWECFRISTNHRIVGVDLVKWP